MKNEDNNLNELVRFSYRFDAVKMLSIFIENKKKNAKSKYEMVWKYGK